MSKEIDSGVNLYDFNRVNMGKLPLLETEAELECAKIMIKNFINANPDTYYMLLNHDNRYFTVFNFKGGLLSELKIKVMANDVIECMKNFGFGIIDISPNEAGNALEVWVKNIETDAVFMYLLFPYGFGVLEY